VILQTVLVTPALLAIVLVVLQAALWFHAGQLAGHAAADAVDAAAAHGARAADGVGAAEAFVADAGGRLADAPVVVVSATAVTATVTVRVPRLVPGWPATVVQRTTGPLERVVPEAGR
jgi:hypothetical protein